MAVMDLIRSPTFIIKTVELVISIIIIAVTSGYQVALGPDVFQRLAVVYGTIIGYIILGIIIIVGYILSCPLDLRLILISSAAAFLMFIVSGGLILDAYSRGSKFAVVLVGGILSLLNGVLYGVDIFLTWKMT